jgi:predicted dehydrogenase
MKLLIAGLGSIGRRHLQNLLAMGERDIVLFRSRLSTLPDDELASFPVETDLDAALAHRPDAVIVSNPTSLHLDVAIPAAEAGCHLLLEKPVSHSLERIEELLTAVKRGGSQVLMGFQFRFHPTLQMAAQLLAEGSIGRLVAARAHWGEYLPNWHPWEDYRQGYSARADLGVGVILTLCHPLDYLGWLLGRPELTWACTGTLGDLGIPVEDVAEIVLRFPNGAIGSVHLYRAAEATWESFSPPDGFERNWMFMEEMRHFLAIARGQAAPRCTLDDGIHALEIAVRALSRHGTNPRNL